MFAFNQLELIQLVGHSSVQSLAKNNIDENVNKQAICIRVTLLNISYFAIQLLSALKNSYMQSTLATIWFSKMLYKYKSVEKHFVFITSKFVFGIFNDPHRHVVLGKMWILDPRRKIHLRQMYLSILLRSSAAVLCI